MKPAAPSDPPRLRLDSPRGALAYTDVGEGPVVLALHGCPGSVRDWRWLGAALEPNFRVIRLDLPGFGETPLSVMPDADFSARAQWVVDVMAQLGVTRFAVMGHSAGGPLALELAASHPAQVTALFLIGAPGLRPHRGIRQQPGIRRISRLLRIPGLRAPLTLLLRLGFERAGFPTGLPADAIRQSMHIIHALRFHRQRENVERVRVPTLIAWTEDDPFIDADISAELARALPAAELACFADGGHYLQKTRSTEIGQAIETMLAPLRESQKVPSP